MDSNEKVTESFEKQWSVEVSRHWIQANPLDSGVVKNTYFYLTLDFKNIYVLSSFNSRNVIYFVEVMFILLTCDCGALNFFTVDLREI